MARPGSQWALAWLLAFATQAPAKPVYVLFQPSHVDSSTGETLQTSPGPAAVMAEFGGERVGREPFLPKSIIGKTDEVIPLEVKQPLPELNFILSQDQFLAERRSLPWSQLEQSTKEAPVTVKVTLTSSDRKLLFRTEPPGATVWLTQVGSGGSLSALGRSGAAETHYLDKLGLLKESWKDTGTIPPVEEFMVTLGGPKKSADGKVEPLPGYQVLENYAVPGSLLNKNTEGTAWIPAKENPPIKLPPAPGLVAVAQRNPHLAMGLGGLGGVLLILLPTVFLPRLRARQKLEAERKAFDALRASVDITRDPLLAQTFDRWTIWKKLGAGGMAVVYWALPNDSADESEAVALKVMNDEVANDPEYQARFKREVQISNELNHPNIVRLISWGEREGRLFLVMEFIRGTTLRDHIPEGGCTPAETLNIMRGLAAGLAHAHKLGVVHRDLKPDNVMINHNRQVKVMDLGLAKRDENKTAITKTGDTFGTPAYMAPEQIAGNTNPDPRTDQYAVGVMLFELLTGRRPFEEEDSLQMIMKHLQAEPPSIREYKPELPEAAAQVVARMLAKDPSQRYPTMLAACAALEDALRPLLAGQA